MWRDLNQNGASDAGELQTLVEAGITSISLTRTDVTGTNAGHDVGFQAAFTRSDGTTGTAQTIYFETDRADTHDDNTPEFTPAEGVDQLPQLPGSGTIHSIAYRASNDPDFRDAWTELTDEAASMVPGELRAAFEELLLQWAGVDDVDPRGRGDHVDGRHLAFVEAFFGDTYRDIQGGQELRTYPGSRPPQGVRWRATSSRSSASWRRCSWRRRRRVPPLARGGDVGEALASPYFFFALLAFGPPAEGDPAPETPGNVGMVVDLIAALLPEGAGSGDRLRHQGPDRPGRHGVDRVCRRS